MNIRTFSDVKVYIETEDILKEKVIYCLTFPNGKKYIGQTISSLVTRVRQHCTDSFNKKKPDFNSKKGNAVRKYMEFTVSILYEGDELDDKEIWFIKELDTFNNGYNLTTGGTNNYKVSEETKIKMSEAALKRERNPMQGKSHSDETKQLLRIKASKAIIQYNIDGSVIKEWESTKLAGQTLGIDASSITKVILGKRKKAGGYIWRNK